MNRFKYLMIACALALAGCNGDIASDQTGPSAAAENGMKNGNGKIDPQLEQFVTEAVSNLALRLDIDEAEVGIAEAQFVTWPNSALGCPEPDMMYTQALVPGYRIRLRADGNTWHYHGARDKPSFHCPAERVSAPAATGSEDSSDVR